MANASGQTSFDGVPVARSAGRVVTKRLVPHRGSEVLSGSPESIRKLIDVAHPALAPVRSFRIEDGRGYLERAFVEGEPVSSLQAASVSLAALKRYFIQLADGLVALHAAGLVHGNIKPSNVFLTQQGAVLTDAAMNEVRREVGDWVWFPLGSHVFVPPEQLVGKSPDPRGDIYALGVLLYHLIAGLRLASDSVRPSDMPVFEMIEHLIRTTAGPETLSRSVPPDWSILIMRSIAPSPDKRFQTAVELRDALHFLRTDESVQMDTEALTLPEVLGPETPPGDELATPDPAAESEGVEISGARIRFVFGVVLLTPLIVVLITVIIGALLLRTHGQAGATGTKSHVSTHALHVEANAPVALKPASDALLTHQEVPFCWTAVPGATEYLLRVDGTSPQTTLQTCRTVRLAPGIYRWSVAVLPRNGHSRIGPSSTLRTLTVVDAQSMSVQIGSPEPTSAQPPPSPASH